jgi:hypothetical protein
MVTLTRYEIHVEGQFLQGAVLAGCYKVSDWQQVCSEAGVDSEEAWESSGDYFLEYPDLEEGEYLFWFTPEGNKEFLKYHGLLIAQATALNEGGEVVILQREYDTQGIIYEDKDQVVYLQ